MKRFILLLKHYKNLQRQGIPIRRPWRLAYRDWRAGYTFVNANDYRTKPNDYDQSH